MKTNVQIEVGVTDAREVIAIVYDKGLLDSKRMKQTSTNTYLIKNVEVDEGVDCDYWDEFNNFCIVLDDAGIEYDVEHL